MNMKKSDKLTENTYNKPYIPLGMWRKCDNCKRIIYHEDLNKTNYICPICNGNMVMSIERRLRTLFDSKSLQEIYCSDEFDHRYIKLQEEDFNKSEYIYTGVGQINTIKVGVAIINDCFSNIKMLDLISKKICVLVDYLIKNKIPLMVITNDDGKGIDNIFSIKYLAMLCSAITKLDREGLLFISVLNNDGCFGTINKFVMNADIVVCETSKNESEKNELLKNGFVDCVATRDELKKYIYNILKLHC